MTFRLLIGQLERKISLVKRRNKWEDNVWKHVKDIIIEDLNNNNNNYYYYYYYFAW